MNVPLIQEGPPGPLSIVPTCWVAAAPVHTNRTVISRCANQSSRDDICVSSAVRCPILCGLQGLVPHDGRCTGPTLCPLSFCALHLHLC